MILGNLELIDLYVYVLYHVFIYVPALPYSQKTSTSYPQSLLFERHDERHLIVQAFFFNLFCHQHVQTTSI